MNHALVLRAMRAAVQTIENARPVTATDLRAAIADVEADMNDLADSWLPEDDLTLDQIHPDDMEDAIEGARTNDMDSESASGFFDMVRAARLSRFTINNGG